MSELRRPTGVASTLFAATLALAGCASAPITAEWSAGASPAFLRGATVMVACEAPDIAVRNICQDALAQALSVRGARPVAVDPQTSLVPGRSLDEQLAAGAQAAGAKGIVVMSLRAAAVDQGSGFSLGLGGFGFGRSSAFGGGVGLPVGGDRIETAFSANGRVSDAVGPRLLWTANASGAPDGDVRSQMAALSASILDAAGKAGLF